MQKQRRLVHQPLRGAGIFDHDSIRHLLQAGPLLVRNVLGGVDNDRQPVRVVQFLDLIDQFNT